MGIETEEDETEYFAVKVDGEELQVTFDELRNGYQRDADYRRKTMALSEDRKAFDAEREQEKAKIDQVVNELSSFIERKEVLTTRKTISQPRRVFTTEARKRPKPGS